MSHWNMDAASALGAHMLDVQPGHPVLDLCAAPGGKSIALAQIIFHAGAKGVLHSIELGASRNKRTLHNLRSYLPPQLFGAESIEAPVRVLRLDAADSRAVTKLPYGPGGYDRVLLDAPCSSDRHIVHAHVKAAASGRTASEITRWSKTTSKRLAKTQADMLITALRAVETGGRVVYSTCSMSCEENDRVVDKILGAVEKERKSGLAWQIRCEFGSKRRNAAKDKTDEILEQLSE